MSNIAFPSKIIVSIDHFYLIHHDDVMNDVNNGNDGSIGVGFVTKGSDVNIIQDAQVNWPSHRLSEQSGRSRKGFKSLIMITNSKSSSRR